MISMPHKVHNIMTVGNKAPEYVGTGGESQVSQILSNRAGGIQWKLSELRSHWLSHLGISANEGVVGKTK
jgi:hypothetical protein